MTASIKRSAGGRLGYFPLFAFALALVSLSEALTNAADGFLRTVALSGQTAPGTSPGALFDSFPEPPSFNELGQVAFLANLQLTAPVTQDNNRGVWSEGGGSLALVAREDDPAPGFPGILFRSFGVPVLNDIGQTAFFGGLRGAGITFANDGAVWSELNGSLEAVARDGEPAPEIPGGAVFSAVGDPAIADNHIAFQGTLALSGGVHAMSDSGLWRGDGAATSLVAREGDPAPGLPAGTTFGTLVDSGSRIAPGGQLAFGAPLQGATSGSGIWLDAVGSTIPVARSGAQAPGTPPGVNFASFSWAQLSINDAGEVAFPAMLEGVGVNLDNDTGVWSQAGGTLDLVAREGDAAPGVAGGVFGQFSDRIAFNELGQTAFHGVLQMSDDITAANDRGLWVERDGGLELVVREGAQAPGAPAGAKFELSGRAPPSIVLNDAGRVALLAALQQGSGGVTFANGTALWAEDLTGALRLIAREGNTLEVMPGDFRTVSQLAFRGDLGFDNGPSSGFNAAGEVAFFAQFTDGSSGVFVSRVATIPEPSAMVGVAFVGIGLGFMRRR